MTKTRRGQYQQAMGTCPVCGQWVSLYRRLISTHGWPACSGAGQRPKEKR